MRFSNVILLYVHGNFVHKYRLPHHFEELTEAQNFGIVPTLNTNAT